jgi:RHS repeat-associated protein
MDGLLAITVTTNGTHFPAYDGNGNVGALVSASSAAQAASYDFGPLGELVRAEGAGASSNPVRFSSKYEDAETDLLYYGHRYYSTSAGRWLSRDPIGERGGLNLYGFVGNSPQNSIDPLGLDLNAITAPLTAQCCGGKVLTEQEKKDKCCENNKLVDKVPVYVINRSEGQRTGITGGHIDLVVPGLGLVGFFGDQRNGSGREVGWNIPGNLNVGQEWINGVTPRPHYTLPPGMAITLRDDQGNPVQKSNPLSTICEIKVCPDDARKMATRAGQIDASPGQFQSAGRNCSTMGCNILGAGGVTAGTISGIDNPQNLIDQLRSKYAAKCFTGYVYWNWQQSPAGQLSPDPNDIRITPSGPAPPGPTGTSY